MRIMIKGGVWKNTEDEILKAAVMKYGLNQWARISSLLVRKSAKQCKARWYEWLDPSIKKTEWTREEDEKLLHLAKIMPTQWRTIAPIVGRTPAQCLERYEKLLDQAANRLGGYDPTEDPRRLRPGEIDPNPESKPARPDPIDMDEDEKEMLSEARARLANTRGKKAKRKAREKYLEEARRLASLQKKRELKAAGIEMRYKDRRRRGVDYNAEVPFEKQPQIGYYDTLEEDQRAREMVNEFRPVRPDEIEGKRRKDLEEEMIKEDQKKQKAIKEGNAPQYVNKQNEQNENSGSRRRGKLMMPPTQVTDKDVELIQKMNKEGQIDDDLLTSGGVATKQLLGSYNQTPARFAGPQRTPIRTPAPEQDSIQLQAENLQRIQHSQTPLVGGEAALKHPSDFSGALPKASNLTTPNPNARLLQTPALTEQSSQQSIAGYTPSIGGSQVGSQQGAGQNLKTPYRDELGLNKQLDPYQTPQSRGADLAMQSFLKNQLKQGLYKLPEPRNEFETDITDIGQQDQEEDDPQVIDMEEVMEQRKLREQKLLEQELKKRSQVLQQNLPRPSNIDQSKQQEATENDFLGMDVQSQAQQLVLKEFNTVIDFDNIKYPQNKSKKDKGNKKTTDQSNIELQEVDQNDTKIADTLLEYEIQQLRKLMGHSNYSAQDYMDTWSTTEKDFIYFPSQNRFERLQALNNQQRVEALSNELNSVKSEMENKAARAWKLESKVKIVSQGLVKRNETLQQDIQDLWNQIQEYQLQLKSFRELQNIEQSTLKSRTQALEMQLQKQQQREKEEQDKYQMLQNQLYQISNQLPFQQENGNYQQTIPNGVV